MDAFDRAAARRQLQILRERANRMSVPDPICVPCQLRQHISCQGTAISTLTNDLEPCHCKCTKETQ